MKKRMISLLLAAAMGVTLLARCGSNNGVSQSSGTNSGKAESSSNGADDTKGEDFRISLKGGRARETCEPCRESHYFAGSLLPYRRHHR